MVFKELVKNILKYRRNPDDLLTHGYLGTLKREISNDLIEAFKLSQPLINDYQTAYSDSNSFFDFLLKICHISIYSNPQETALKRDLEMDNADMQRRFTEEKQKLKEDLEKSHKESTDQLKNRLQKCQKELNESTDQLQTCRKQLQETTNQLQACQKQLMDSTDQLLKCEKQLKDEACKMEAVDQAQLQNLITSNGKLMENNQKIMEQFERINDMKLNMVYHYLYILMGKYNELRQRYPCEIEEEPEVSKIQQYLSSERMEEELQANACPPALCQNDERLLHRFCNVSIRHLYGYLEWFMAQLEARFYTDVNKNTLESLRCYLTQKKEEFMDFLSNPSSLIENTLDKMQEAQSYPVFIPEPLEELQNTIRQLKEIQLDYQKLEETNSKTNKLYENCTQQLKTLIAKRQNKKKKVNMTETAATSSDVLKSDFEDRMSDHGREDSDTIASYTAQISECTEKFNTLEATYISEMERMQKVIDDLTHRIQDESSKIREDERHLLNSLKQKYLGSDNLKWGFEIERILANESDFLSKMKEECETLRNYLNILSLPVDNFAQLIIEQFQKCTIPEDEKREWLQKHEIQVNDLKEDCKLKIEQKTREVEILKEKIQDAEKQLTTAKTKLENTIQQYDQRLTNQISVMDDQLHLIEFLKTTLQFKGEGGSWGRKTAQWIQEQLNLVRRVNEQCEAIQKALNLNNVSLETFGQRIIEYAQTKLDMSDQELQQLTQTYTDVIKELKETHKVEIEAKQNVIQCLNNQIQEFNDKITSYEQAQLTEDELRLLTYLKEESVDFIPSDELWGRRMIHFIKNLSQQYRLIESAFNISSISLDNIAVSLIETYESMKKEFNLKNSLFLQIQTILHRNSVEDMMSEIVNLKQKNADYEKTFQAFSHHFESPPHIPDVYSLLMDTHYRRWLGYLNLDPNTKIENFSTLLQAKIDEWRRSFQTWVHLVGLEDTCTEVDFKDHLTKIMNDLKKLQIKGIKRAAEPSVEDAKVLKIDTESILSENETLRSYLRVSTVKVKHLFRRLYMAYFEYIRRYEIEKAPIADSVKQKAVAKLAILNRFNKKHFKSNSDIVQLLLEYVNQDLSILGISDQGYPQDDVAEQQDSVDEFLDKCMQQTKEFLVQQCQSTKDSEMQ